MIRSCLPSLPQFSPLSYLFSYANPSPPALSPSKPQLCDLSAIPYTSWSPPACPQKCEGVCLHIPVSSEARVSGQGLGVSETQKKKDVEVEVLSAEEKRRHEDVDMMIEAAKEESEVGGYTNAGGSGVGLVIATALPASTIEMVGGELTPDLASLCGSDDDDDHGDGDLRTDSHGDSVRSYASSQSSVSQRTGTTHQATADWLDKLSTSDSDDEAAIIGLYDVDLDDESREDTHALDDSRRACVLHDVVTDNESFIEIGASPNVVKDAALSLAGGTDTKHTEGKARRPLSHVFFFPIPQS